MGRGPRPPPPALPGQHRSVPERRVLAPGTSGDNPGRCRAEPHRHETRASAGVPGRGHYGDGGPPSHRRSIREGPGRPSTARRTASGTRRRGEEHSLGPDGGGMGGSDPVRGRRGPGPVRNPHHGVQVPGRPRRRPARGAQEAVLDGRLGARGDHSASQGSHRGDPRRRAHGLDPSTRREVRRSGAHGRGSGLRRHAGRGRHRPGRVVPPVRGPNSNNQPNEKRKHS